MAYNGGFPMTYQQYYPMQPNVYSPQQSNIPVSSTQNGIIWVQGEAGAKSYLVAPNNTVQLWDSESQTIYLKSADASGMPSMKILDYKIRNQEQAATPNINTNDFATINDINNLKTELSRLNREIMSIKEANNAKHEHDSDV